MRKFLLSIFCLVLFVNAGFCQQQLKWLNENALPLTTRQQPDDRYLAALANCLKDNKVCALGEASHGTREFTLEKNRIVEYLVTNTKYRSVGLEFGYSPIAAINTYIQTGKGDLKAMMQPLRLFNTREFFELFEWMRAYNAQHAEADRVKLFGFDTNYFKVDIDVTAIYTVNYLRKNPAVYADTAGVIKALTRLSQPDINTWDLDDTEQGLLAKLNEKTSVLPLSGDGAEFKKYVSLLYQGTLMGNPLARDEFMAQNIAAEQQSSQAKTIIWGHNVHMAKDTTMAKVPATGYYVRKQYGKAFYAIGFDTYKGKVTVLNGDIFEQRDFEAAAESFAGMFAQVKYPAFFVGIDQGSPLYGVQKDITNIFANWSNNRALPVRAGIDFDALIFIKETTPSKIIN